jgi:hypothetical protein
MPLAAPRTCEAAVGAALRERVHRRGELAHRPEAARAVVEDALADLRRLARAAGCAAPATVRAATGCSSSAAAAVDGGDALAALGRGDLASFAAGVGQVRLDLRRSSSVRSRFSAFARP